MAIDDETHDEAPVPQVTHEVTLVAVFKLEKNPNYKQAA
jgi:hypothetical protein